MSNRISKSEREALKNDSPATPKGNKSIVDNTKLNEDLNEGFGDNSYINPLPPKQSRSIGSVASVDDIPRSFLKPSDIVDEHVTILSARFEDSVYNGKTIPNVWLTLFEYDKELVTSGKAVVAQMQMVKDSEEGFPVEGHFELVKRGQNNRWEFVD